MTFQAHPLPDMEAKACELASSAPIEGLSPIRCRWLYLAHEVLARALHAAQSAASSLIASEPTILVDALPERTRQYLWRGIRAHHPALAAWLREASVRAMRKTFNAQLHLYAHDVIHVIGAADRDLPATQLRVAIGDEANV